MVDTASQWIPKIATDVMTLPTRTMQPSGEPDVMKSTFGPAIDFTAYDKSSRNLLDDIVSECTGLHSALQTHMKEPWNRQVLRFHILNSPTVNAYVHSRDGMDYVGVTLGLVEHVYGTMSGLMSVPTFLPTIGKPTVEIAPRPSGRVSFPMMPMLLHGDTSTKVETLLPNDPARLLFAKMLAETAISFVLFHEIGHLAGGHFELLTSRPPGHLHFGMTLGDSTVRFDQLLESDADAFAGHTLSRLHHDRTLADVGHDIIRTPSWTSQELSILTMFTGVYVLFKLLNFPGDERTAISVDEHPHESVRCFFVSTCAMARSVYHDFISLQSHFRIYAATIQNIEETWDAMGFPRRRALPPLDWANSVGNEMKKLFNNLENNRDRFNQAARCERYWCDWDRGTLMTQPSG